MGSGTVGLEKRNVAHKCALATPIRVQSDKHCYWKLQNILPQGDGFLSMFICAIF